MSAPSGRAPRGAAPAPLQTKAKGGAGLLALVFGGVLVVGGGLFALVHFFGESPKSDIEMLAYLPADATLVITVDVDEVAKSERIKGLLIPPDPRRLPSLPGIDPSLFPLLKAANIELTDVAQIMTGLREFRPTTRQPGGPKTAGADSSPKVFLPPPAGVPEGDHNSIVLRMKQKFDQAKLIAAWAGEEKKGSKTSYVLGGPSAAEPKMKCFFPSDTLIVFTRNDKLLGKLLSADASKPAISPELQEMVKRVDRGHIGFAMNRHALLEKSYFEIKDEGWCPFLSAEVIDAIKDLKTAGGALRIDGSRVEILISVTCSDAALASRGAARLKQLVDENHSVAVNDHPKIVEYKKKNPAKIVSPSVWDACKDIQRTAMAGLNGNAIEFTAEFAAEDLEALLGEMTTIRPAPKGAGGVIPVKK